MHLAAQLAQAPIQFAFDRRQPRFRALKSLLRRVCRGDADLRETRCVLAQLANWILVQLFQLGPFVLDDFLELFDALLGVLLEPGASVVPIGEMGLEASDGASMALRRERPPPDDFSALLGEQRETLLRRRHVPG